MPMIDRAILTFDRALRTLCGVPRPTQASPAGDIEECELDDAAKRRVVALMRVNHAGEVAAQALYQGQAATARLDTVRAAMDQAADEENDHLAWCEARLHELGGRTSLIGPVWYAGGYTVGAVAGLAGDDWSLGFVAETERQVVRHLSGHLQRLPDADRRSRAVLERMLADEARHGTTAMAAGGRELPGPVRVMMGIASKVMTKTAYWI